MAGQEFLPGSTAFHAVFTTDATPDLLRRMAFLRFHGFQTP
jgi:hypothetical protein